MEELSRAGGLGEQVISMLEIEKDESLYKCGTLVEVDQPKRGKFLTVGCPCKFSNYSPVVTPAPALGANTDEVLKSIGYTDEEIAQLRSKHNIISK